MVALLLAASAGPGWAAENGHSWRTYSNDRFGYSVCYPADLLQPQSEGDNHAGITLTAADGASMAVWGSYNALDQTLAEAEREAERRLTAKSGEVTYQAKRKTFYVLSGRRGTEIFYNLTNLTHGQFSAVELVYPAAKSKIWNAVAAKINKCFRPG